MPENNGQISSNDRNRISKLEVRVGHLESDTDKMENHMSGLKEDMSEIKEHLAKQNGAIPHLQESMGRVENTCERLNQQMSEYKIDKAKTDTKSKVAIGITTVIGAAALGALAKAYVPAIIKAIFGLALFL